MKTLGDLGDLGDLQFEEICWNWNCCRFTWQVLKSLRNHTSHRVGGLFGYPVVGLIYGVLGDQEPSTANRGCRIVSVEIVVRLSNILLTCRAGVIQSPSITVV